MTSIYKTDEGKRLVLSFYESLLKQWHKPSKKHVIETTFGDTFIMESGRENAQPVFLLHGSSSNAGMWTADVKELSRNYRVFAIDIIGECGKSAENRPSFNSNSYSGWLYEIINKLGLEKVLLVGYSLGGWIALDFAAKYPEKTIKLVLMATAGIVQVKAKTVIWIIITSLLGSWGFNKLNKIVYENLEIDNTTLEFASMIKHNYKPRTDVLPLFHDDFLQKINTPTLFIGGEKDCFYNSEKTVSRLKKNLKNIQCLVLKNAGHILMNQTNNILQFLNS